MATTGGLSGSLSLPVPVAAARAVAAPGRGSVLKSTEDERVVGRGRRLGEHGEEGKRKARMLVVVRLRRTRRRKWCRLLLGGDGGGIAVYFVCVG